MWVTNPDLLKERKGVTERISESKIKPFISPILNFPIRELLEN